MADQLSTTMVRAALEAPAVDEYVSSLSHLLLVQTKLEGSSVLSDRDFQMLVGEMLAAGPRNGAQAAARFLAQRMPSMTFSGQVATGVVQTALRLEAGALASSAETMKATYTYVRPESPKPLWWLVHAGCLGMCYWAARMGADGEVPATEVVDYVGQYAGFLFQASGQPVLGTVQDVVEVFELASSAIYGAVEPRPRQIFRFRQLLEGEEIAERVDRLTDGQWRFRQAVRELDELWTNLYSRL